MKLAAPFALACLVAPLAAQTHMDRRHPLLLPAEGVIAGRIAEDEQGEAYYTFTAGPGPLVITVDIIPNNANINIDLGVFDPAGHAKLAMNPRAYNDKSVMESKRIVLPKAERLVLKLGRNWYEGTGTFRIQVAGAGIGGAQSVDLPAQGTLRLTMKDGKTLEVDLTKVQSAKVVSH